jgi:predicted RecB family endonuclease
VDDAGSAPMRLARTRASDAGIRGRLRGWWSENGVQTVVFLLLGVIVLGEVSDFYNDRSQDRTNDALVCSVGNLSEQSSESLNRLRQQAPTMTAARQIIAADTAAERLAAAEELRRVGVPEFDNDELAEPEDCPTP